MVVRFRRGNDDGDRRTSREIRPFNMVAVKAFPLLRQQGLV